MTPRLFHVILFYHPAPDPFGGLHHQLRAGDPPQAPALKHCPMIAAVEALGMRWAGPAGLRRRQPGPNTGLRGGESFLGEPADWWGCLSFNLALQEGRWGERVRVPR